jgi:hypothetical protein
VGNAQASWQREVAAVRLQLAANQCEQAGLAGAIGANQTHLLAAMNGEADVIEQQACAATQG